MEPRAKFKVFVKYFKSIKKDNVFAFANILIGIAAVLVSYLALKTSNQIKELVDVVVELRNQTSALNSQNVSLQAQTKAIIAQSKSLTDQVELQGKSLALYENSLIEERPPQFLVKKFKVNEDTGHNLETDGNIEIILENKGRKAILENAFFIQEATLPDYETHYVVEGYITLSDLFPNRNHENDPSSLGHINFPVYVYSNESIRLKFRKASSELTGTGTFFRMKLTFKDVEGITYSQHIEGVPRGKFVTGSLNKE